VRSAVRDATDAIERLDESRGSDEPQTRCPQKPGPVSAGGDGTGCRSVETTTGAEATVRTPLSRRSTVVAAKCRRKTSRLAQARSVGHVVHALVDELVHAVGAELAAEARALGPAEGDLRALT